MISIQYGDQMLEPYIEPDERLTITFDDNTSVTCELCGEEFSDLDELDSSAPCATAENEDTGDDEDREFPHEVPDYKRNRSFTWVNNISVDLDEAKDVIKLSVSMGDRRGAFVFQFGLNDDGSRYMITPHPDEVGLHLPLVRQQDGRYRIGS